MKKKLTLTQRFYAKEELTVAERKLLQAGEWRINRVRCNKCEDIITSNNRHDFNYCKCNNIAVDGGSWYLKRVGDIRDDSYEELSEKYEDLDEEDGEED